MAADARIQALLVLPGVPCTLRRQPRHLTVWFYEALRQYSLLWVRKDREDEAIAGLLQEIFTLLKFVALPNNIDRKEAALETKWPSLEARITEKLHPNSVGQAPV